MTKIIILGAGGFAREVKDTIEAALRAAGSSDSLEGFVVEASYYQPGVSIAGKPVLGDFGWLARQDSPDLRVICGVGSPEVRQRFARQVKQGWYRAVNPFSFVSPQAQLNPGVVISAGCAVGNQAELGEHVILNRLASVGHDSVLEGFVTVSPGVNIAGNVRIETGCYIGIGATIIEGITVGKWSSVAAGSVITKDIPAYSTVAGNPGRVIKSQPPG